MAARHDASPRALAKTKRKQATSRGGGLTAKVRKALGALIEGDATTLRDAAASAGLSSRALRYALTQPLVRGFYREQVEALRNAEQAMNLRALVGIRDDEELKKTAAGQTARIKAVQVLEGETDRPGANINVGVGVQVVPGYVIDLREPDEQQPGEVRSRLIDMPPSEPETS